MYKSLYFILAVLILFITMGQAQVTVDFSVNKSQGCGSLQSQFTDLSSSASGSLVDWEWDLGGGVQSALQNPGRVFVDIRKYQICLTVTDDQGNSDKLCKDDFIEVFGLPTVDFLATPSTGCVPLDVEFNDISTVENGGIKRMIWGLGGNSGVLDGGDELSSVSSLYVLADDYTVSLTIEDQKGCVNTASKSELIRVGGIPRPAVSVGNPFGCQTPHMSEFSLLQPDINLAYEWDFGNGQTFEGAIPSVQMYTEPGSYALKLIVSNIASGCRDTFYYREIVRVGIENLPSVNLEEGCVNSKFTFQDTSEHIADAYLWDFGDGATSAKSKISHEYTQSGCYTVSLTKTIGSCQSTIEIDACIRVIERPLLELSYDKRAACKLPADFNLSVDNNSVTIVLWTIGVDSDPISGDSIVITADTFGIIPFEVRARYLPGCWLSMNDTLFVGDLRVSLPGDGYDGCVPFNSSLSDTLNAQFDIVEWDWILKTNPVQSSTDKQAEFQIIEAGNFDLELIVKTADGCADSILAPGYLRGGIPPDLSFAADILTTCSDTTINFSTTLSSPADEFFWIFGDGGTSMESNPGYVYGDTGLFTVTLFSAYNGCPAIDSIENYITIYAPIAGFAYQTDCDASLFTLEDRSLAADSIFWEISWNGSAYTTSTLRNPIISLPGNGLFEITQTAWNYSSGCIDYHVDTLIYGDPAIDMVFSGLVGCAPHIVHVTNNTRNIASWRWFAPGGVIANDTAVNPEIEYLNPGVFDEIRVEVTDLNGCTYDIDLGKKAIVGMVTPYFGDQRINSCPGSLVTLSDSTISAIPIVNWNWIIGNGLAAATGEVVSIAIDSVGFFSVSLQVEDSIGCVSEIAVDTAIIIRENILKFSSDSMSCIGADIDFELEQPQSDYVYNWTFGTGDVASGPQVTYAYQTEGVYQVCVEIMASPGCDTAFCRSVEIVSVTADFSYDTAFADCPPLIVNFQNLSTHSTYYEWDFGDNAGTSPLVSPSHVYTAPGEFDVSLIAWLNAQCMDTMQVDSLIRLKGPEGNFFFETDSECLPVAARFFGASVDLYDYIWDYGNGGLDTTGRRVLFDTSATRYTEAGKYVPRLILIDNAFCKRTLVSPDTIFVYDMEAGEDQTICNGEIAFIHGQVPIGAPKWLTNPFISDPLLLEFETAPDTTTNYILELIAAKCTLRDTVTITVEYFAQLDAVGDTVCPGDTARLKAFGDIESYAWFDSKWELLLSDTTGDLSVVPAFSEIFHAIGFKSVCIPDTVDVEVVRHNDIAYSLPEHVIAYPGEVVELPLDLVIPDIYNITWLPDDDLSCVNCPSPLTEIDSSIQFFVRIVGKGTGCSANDSVSFLVPGHCTDDFVFVPNVFSPNGDGDNDELRVYTKKYSEMISFGIFDRWGNTVFTADNFDTPWNGTVKGRKAPSGVYVYALRLRCPINNSIVGFTGDITLLR